jgi:hypothetical protein
VLFDSHRRDAIRRAYTGRFLGSGVQGRGPWREFGGVPQASLSAAAGGVPNKPTHAKNRWAPIDEGGDSHGSDYLPDDNC